ncbi:L-cysteine desulfhydrase-like [Mizuhopecten yessoensis]|uniref:Isopenicillin N epimerase n=1 Tax=Mizuhopecten yessoensis TaxID=6573 RepID=A0A210PLN7_MIZYE|nr:L-cysteine desulfhydrase-like [Mizuhopecten yessoensis]XP_021380227.1 L-cysteine desulfhydrase-like [Mizuhopecten yessoensis]OWF37410.1 Isopenicillin N epimerase [Mizuhopecten yessoensis]
MQKNIKRDFGSFHASNVQELLELPEEEYQPPSFPVVVPRFTDCQLETGHSCRCKHFLLEEDCTFINHGAFGGVLREAMDSAQEWQRYVERQPLRFYDRELLPHLVYVTRRLAKFVCCDPTDLVLVINVTTAINSVVRGLDLHKGDIIYVLSVTYGAVKKLLQCVCERTGAVLQEVQLNFPVTSKEQVITLVKDTLRPGVKLALFDHIPSNAPVILPLKEIISICKDRGVPVLVDGAHALGALPLDIRALDPDYYVSNAHKWFCCPKGSAFLYVRKELKSQTRPLIISHGFGSGFNSEFIWAGLHDYSPFLAMHVNMNFWKDIGNEKIQQYMYDLCRESCNLLTSLWNTKLAAPMEMFGCMALVELPPQLYSSDTAITYSTGEAIQNQLYHQYNIEVPVKCIQGTLYVRISCHIYNELAEYEKLGNCILEMCSIKEKSGIKRPEISDTHQCSDESNAQIVS